MPHQTEQRGSPDRFESPRRQERVEPLARQRQAFLHLFPPALIAERRDGHVNCHSRDGPRPERLFHLSRDIRFRDEETEPHPGKPVGLPERPQYDHSGLRNRRHDAEFGLGKLGEGLVDDQATPRARPSSLQLPQRLGSKPATIGVVGIAENGDIAFFQRFDAGVFDHRGAGGVPRCRELSVSGGPNDHPFGGENTGQRRNQDLRAGRNGDQIRIARTVGRRRGLLEGADMYRLGQARIGCLRNRRHRVGEWIDARRQIDERLGRVRKSLSQERQLAAVADHSGVPVVTIALWFETNLLILVAALVIEAIFGYPKPLFAGIAHPVVWTGDLLGRMERRWNRPTLPERRRRLNGTICAIVLLIVSAGAAHRSPDRRAIGHAVVDCGFDGSRPGILSAGATQPSRACLGCSERPGGERTGRRPGSPAPHRRSRYRRSG